MGNPLPGELSFNHTLRICVNIVSQTRPELNRDVLRFGPAKHRPHFRAGEQNSKIFTLRVNFTAAARLI